MAKIKKLVQREIKLASGKTKHYQGWVEEEVPDPPKPKAKAAPKPKAKAATKPKAKAAPKPKAKAAPKPKAKAAPKPKTTKKSD